MPRMTSIAGVVAASALLIAAGAPSANAATGVFSYVSAITATEEEIVDPVDGQCYPLEESQGIVGVENGTDTVVTIYDAAACQGNAVAQLQPGQTAETVAPAGSVVFVPAASAVAPAPESTTPEGTTSEGTAPEGTAPEGTAPEGTAPEGTAPEGTTPEGTAPEGTTPEETTSTNPEASEDVSVFAV